MKNWEPETESIEITDTAPPVSDLVQAVARSRRRVVLEEDGKPKAAVLSYREFEFFKQMKAQRDRRFLILTEMREAFKDVPPAEIEREVAKALAEVRAEMREERRLADGPDPDGAVRGARRQELAIGREGRAVDVAGVPFERPR